MIESVQATVPGSKGRVGCLGAVRLRRVRGPSAQVTSASVQFQIGELKCGLARAAASRRPFGDPNKAGEVEPRLEERRDTLPGYRRPVQHARAKRIRSKPSASSSSSAGGAHDGSAASVPLELTNHWPDPC